MRPYPKKQFGQHFLRDTGVLTRLERLIQPVPTDCFVEIGAGDGALSRMFAPRVERLIAVEVDEDLMPSLQGALTPFPNAQAIHADVLDLDFEKLLRDLQLDPARTRLLGNLPYNIASPIIHTSLRLTPPVRDMTFMVQLEVAQRIISIPGSRTYGYLSVDCQHRAEVHMLLKVSPACFSPRPKVMSAVIRLRPRVPGSDQHLDAAFDDLVKAAFAYRRKTIENSYRRHPVFGPTASMLLERAGIQGIRRAEDLSVSEYEHLAGTYISLERNQVRE